MDCHVIGVVRPHQILTRERGAGSCSKRVCETGPAGRTVTGIDQMRIVDIRECAVPLKSNMRNSSFDFSDMTTSVVAVMTDVVREGRPVTGFAFNSTGRYACGAAMRARFIPRILSADPQSLLDEAGTNFHPGKILAVMMQREKSGGHSERSIAIGTIEVAVWDAVAKIAGKPLHRVLAERYNAGKIADKVFCYVGGGWYRPGQTAQDLQDEMRRHLDTGYTMLKMKVGGLPLAEDVRRVEAVKTTLPAAAQLAVDANSKFGRAEALAYAKALAPFRLRWFEEPCDPLDFALLAEIAGHYDAPLATGENLFSTQDVENLVRFGGLHADRDDVIQVDPPQCYGIVQFARTVEMLARHGWPRRALFPHGGNQMSLAIAAGFGLGGAESYPGVFGAFGGFADDAKLNGGYLTLSDRPGIGFEGQSALYAIMRELVA
jgi:D(-)-tartrate dehydratase